MRIQLSFDSISINHVHPETCRAGSSSCELCTTMVACCVDAQHSGIVKADKAKAIEDMLLGAATSGRLAAKVRLRKANHGIC